MEIGTLGLIHSIAAKGVSGKAGSSETKGNFAGLLSLMMGSDAAVEETLQTSLPSGVSSADIQGLKQFFQVNDLFEFDDGYALFDKVLSGTETDLLKAAMDVFGVSEEEWREFAEKLQVNSDPAVGENWGDGQEDGANMAEASTDPAVFLAFFLAVPDWEFPGTLNRDSLGILKALKLYDLLAKHQDSANENSRMPELVKQMAVKLETLTAEMAKTDKQQYLHKVFQPIVTEFIRSSSVNQLAGGESEPEVNPVKLEAHAGQPVIPQQMSRPEQLSMMLEKSGRPVSTEQLIQQFESILARGSFSRAGGTQRLLIKLYPEHLGALRVELIQKDQTMVARILATTGMAKNALESQVHGLKQAFASQQIQIERVEILQQPAQQERFMDKGQQQQHERQQEEKQAREDRQSNHEFNESFEEALLNLEV